MIPLPAVAQNIGSVPPGKVAPFEFKKLWINSPDKATIQELEKASELISNFPGQAIALLTPKAETGDPNYQYLLGAAYMAQFHYALSDKEKKVQQDKALYWYKESGYQGHIGAQTLAGLYYWLNLHEIDKAITWFEMASASPFSDGQTDTFLGLIYVAGQDKPVDYKKAEEYFKRGAEKGFGVAQDRLGDMYYTGKAGIRDLKEAAKWTRKAAEHDDNYIAQYRLAEMYRLGQITGQPDFGQFEFWATKSAKANGAPAMLALGEFYHSGEGGSVDEKKAAKWLRQAALKKIPHAQFMLAQMYEEGRGVPQDFIQAYIYYRLAEDGNYPLPPATMKTLRAKMTSAQLTHAEKLMAVLKE